jgi:uncharacterized phage protein (TIGR01671 family)
MKNERIIKFRGKVPKEYQENFFKEKFVYGNYYGSTDDEIVTIINDEFEAEILTDTLGQFTGMYDINGKEIYEDDIVRGCMYNGSFCDGIIEYVGNSFVAVPIPKFTEGNSDDFKLMEVVGNIYDNPELLTN